MKSFIHVWLVVSLLPRIAISSDESSRLFSSIQCIGGSQILDTQSLSWAMRQGDQLSKFPMNDPEHRSCLLRNVCIDHGNLTYYITDFHHANIPIDYLPEGFNGRVTHLAHLRGFTMPIETVVGNIPKKHIWSEIPLTYLDANSWSFNYGHYLIDNVLPAFTAAKLFNLPFSDSQQIFETKCRLFTTLEESFSRRRVDFNKSMGTYQSVCLERLNGMGEYFFDHLPLYVDDIRSSALCFKKLMVGQGSSFGLKSVDLTRAMILREFRDYVLQKNGLQDPHHGGRHHTSHGGQSSPTVGVANSVGVTPVKIFQPDNVILVGARTAGAAGGAIIDNLCSLTKAALAIYEDGLQKSTLPDHIKARKFHVECVTPAELTFLEEIKQARKAKIIITLHGTISYLSLFARDGTQQISIANPKEYKENQILLYATHTQLHYLNWDRIKELHKVLTHAITLSNAYYFS